MTVKRARATSKAVTSPSATISAVRVPKLPRREGEYLTTATIDGGMITAVDEAGQHSVQVIVASASGGGSGGTITYGRKR